KTSNDNEQERNNSLISRDLLFGNPDRVTARISPDGKQLSFLAPLNGVMNVWVGPSSQPDMAMPVTNDTYRGIRNYGWAFTNQHIIYLQDKNGDENWRIYSVNLSNKKVKDLTPFTGVQAQIEAISYKFPHEIMVGLNKRDPEYHDIYRLNIDSGNLTLFLENKEFAEFNIDDEFRIRLASKTTSDGGTDLFKPLDDGWETFMRIGKDDAMTTGVVGMNKTNDVIYFADSRGRDTSALFALNLTTSEEKMIAEDPKADYDDFMLHPREKNVEAVAFTYDRKNWTVINETIASDLAYLRTLEKGDIEIVSRSLDDKAWIVVYTVDDGPLRYYYYDHDQKKAKFLFTDKEKLQGQGLAKMVPIIIKSRDGLDLVSYYTLPLGSDSNSDGKPDMPLPMVLDVHGGPWDRDDWGYNSEHQWLANRGYAVLSVNFRGSTGFGKNFTNAGDLEWGGKMQNDLIDAVAWAIQQGIADPDKIAIMGGSYGGYATLAGLTFTPETFDCGVDIVGPSNLTSLLQSIPPYWKPELDQLTTRVGDFRTEDGKKLLRERSPLTYADSIARPLLIGQGANDPRVKQNESDQIVEAMQAKKLPVTYVLYADEGHGFARPENRLSFYAIAEAFLAKHLGGKYEPIGKDFEGANFTVPAGADEVPGLIDALERKS
ncbi:MAG: S9 family peptidase, partial [Methanotrichaceae archaeon]|nr:S9 family peptidase [Methanotrichaceae archaeon]